MTLVMAYHVTDVQFVKKRSIILVECTSSGGTNLYREHNFPRRYLASSKSLLEKNVITVQGTIWPLRPSTMSKDINGHIVITDGMPLRRGSLAHGPWCAAEGGGTPAQPAPPSSVRTDRVPRSPRAERTIALRSNI
ncbi:unnamed protein product [Colias eurytheme]|nr:unnamed protein product [Colias eurytheme]